MQPNGSDVLEAHQLARPLGSNQPWPSRDAPGRTPLIRLGRVSATLPAGVEMWGKAEFLNPSGSVKDRAAYGIVRAAFAEGLLGRGQTLVDASSGNTAVAYAALGARHGFPVELYVPRNANPNRLASIRAFGAMVVLTDPLEGTDGAQRMARRRAEERPDSTFYADQYNNPENPRAHYTTTGPEIWADTQGRITHLVAGVGTGGTISGTGRFLKEQDGRIKIVGVEPAAPLHGIEGLKHLPSAVRPGAYDDRFVDQTLRVETEDARRMVERLVRDESLTLGTSSGAAVVAALGVGASLRAGVMVVVLPDSDQHVGSPSGLAREPTAGD